MHPLSEPSQRKQRPSAKAVDAFLFSSRLTGFSHRSPKTPKRAEIRLHRGMAANARETGFWEVSRGWSATRNCICFGILELEFLPATAME